MSEKNHNTNPPDNPEKKPSKIRHTEDEKRITHENTAEESRLEHEETAEDENILRHEDEETADKTALRHEGTDDSSDTRDNLLPAVRKPEELAIPPETPTTETINGAQNNGGTRTTRTQSPETATQRFFSAARKNPRLKK